MDWSKIKPKDLPTLILTIAVVMAGVGIAMSMSKVSALQATVDKLQNQVTSLEERMRGWYF